MKTKLLKSTVFNLGLIALFACQQVPQANNNGGYNDGSADTGNEVGLCPDGTLNCLVDFPEGSTTIINNSTIFDQSFNTCMTTCLSATTCSDYSPVEDAQESCPDSYATCADECEWSSSESPYANMPSCEPIGIPENPKAVKVEVTGCYDEEAPYEIHFTGPSVSFKTILEAKRNVWSIVSIVPPGGWGEAKIGYGVGRSPKCEEAYKNRIKVKFTPIAETTLTLNDQTIAITPFGNTASFEKVYARPDNLSFGIPQTIRDETDLSQMSWIVSSFSEPSNDMKNERYGFCHYKNDNPYGTSMVMLDYDKKLTGASYTNQTVTMYLLVKGL